MLSKLFKKKDRNAADSPSILGLRVGGSFELDALAISLINKESSVEIGSTHIIAAVGAVETQDFTAYRFYTNDEGWLQVVFDGEPKEENVIDVKLFKFGETIDVVSDQIWDSLLNKEIGQPQYFYGGHEYQRVWTSADEYHMPVAMTESTFETDQFPAASTDQFVMLFERELSGGEFESLFVSAEERLNDRGQPERLLVLSTGISINRAMITIY